MAKTSAQTAEGTIKVTVSGRTPTQTGFTIPNTGNTGARA